MVYTMVKMSKPHNLNIYKYLNYPLERLPGTAIALYDMWMTVLSWSEVKCLLIEL